MQEVTSIDDIETLDGMVRDITSRLSYPMGSILKIAGRYLGNFSISVSEQTRQEIERLSLQRYYDGWKRAAKVTLDAIKTATRDAGFPIDNSNLNEHVGKMAVEILLGMAHKDKTRTFRIWDIGAGDGETTGAVFDAIVNMGAFELAERCSFTLLEPSKTNLFNAAEALENHRINQTHQVDLTIVGKTNHNFLRRLREGDADLVISSAVFHHMIFPTYLQAIRESLAEDGVLVIGDWYTTTFKYPAFVAEILKSLNIDKTGLLQFQSLFEVSDTDARELSLGMDRDEIITDYRMQRYIVAIGRAFQQIPPEHRDEFLEGHVSFRERKEDLEGAGFNTDIAGLQEHPGFFGRASNIKNVDPYGAARVFGVAKMPLRPPPAPEAGNSGKKPALPA